MCTLVEAAEHFIVFQTKDLDTYDQTLHTAYKKVSQNYYYPVQVATFKAGKHEHNLHHSCMADCEGSDTDKGKSIGKIAQQDFEHFEQTLYNEHSFFLWHNLRFLFYQSCKWLFEEDQDQRYAKHDKEYDSSRKCMSCEYILCTLD